MDLLKNHIQKTMQVWLDQIRSSETQSINMDLSKTMLRLMQKYILHVVFGSDIDDEAKLMIMIQQKDYTFAPQECTLSEAVDVVFI